MGVSRSPAELAAKFTKLQAGLAGAQREGVRAGALLVTNSVRRELRSAAPSGRLSGVGRRGAKVSVGFDAPKSLTNPVALVRMRGPAHLIENPTKPHVITPRRGRRGGKRAVVTPAGPRARVQHPGTKGKQPWAKGVRASEHLVLRAIKRETEAAMFKAFR